MNDIPFVDSLLFGRLQSASRSLFWVGLGIVVLLISGILTLVGSFSIHSTGPFFGTLLLGLLSIGAGISCWATRSSGRPCSSDLKCVRTPAGELCCCRA